MKKLISLLLVLSICTALFAACGKSENSATPTATTVAVPETTAGPTEPSTMPTVATTPMDTESTGSTDATMMPESTDMGTNPAGRRIPGGR